MKKTKNLFYVAHPKILNDIYSANPRWAKPTLKDAIEHAERILNKQVTFNGERLEAEECLIVKVIRVVRLKVRPVEVELIK